MVRRIGEERGETKRSFKVQTHEHWLGGGATVELVTEHFCVNIIASSLAEVVLPKSDSFFSDFSASVSSDFLSTSIAFKKLHR